MPVVTPTKPRKPNSRTSHPSPWARDAAKPKSTKRDSAPPGRNDAKPESTRRDPASPGRNGAKSGSTRRNAAPAGRYAIESESTKRDSAPAGRNGAKSGSTRRNPASPGRRSVKSESMPRNISPWGRDESQSQPTSRSLASTGRRAANSGPTPRDAPPAGRNTVRIIAGAWRGRRVSFPDLPGLRPTPDRVRETLFNWLQHSIAGTRCLDLFSGSGALGLEALSRGAVGVVFVEQAQAAARGLLAELQRLGGSTKARVVEMGASRFLRGSGESFGKPFDVVFLDPPYHQGALLDYIPLLDAGEWLRTGGLVYLESEKAAGKPVLPDHWELLKSKFAGEVGYHLARVNARAGT